MSDEERLLVLGEAAAKYASFADLGPIQQNQEMGAWLATHKDFEAAGSDEMAAWASFHDGRLAIYNNTDRIDPDMPAQMPLRADIAGALPARPAQTATEALAPRHHPPAVNAPKMEVMGSSRTGMPSSTDVCLYSSLGDNAWFEWLEQMFELTDKDGNRRFKYATWKITAAGVEEFKRLPATCGVLGIDAHGYVMKDKFDADIYSVYTATETDSSLEDKYKIELDSRQLAYYTHWPYSRDPTHYAITSRFVEAYWSFPVNSLVWANTCRGANEVAGPFQAAVLKKGASVYASWTGRSMNAIGQQTAVYAFDRMLGANHYTAMEDPNQRPFAWNTLAADMKNKELGEYPDEKYPPFVSRLLIDGSGNGSFGMLAPSIAYVAVDDAKDELIITGAFDPVSKIEVKVAGNVRPLVQPAKSTELRVSIPKFGDGSSGEVVVIANGNESNHARLTAWKGKVTYRITGPSNGLQQEWTIELNLRGDVRDFRTEPGVAPPHREKIFSPMQDSTATVVAKGSYFDAKYRVTWGGNKTVGLLGSASTSLLDALMGGGQISAAEPNKFWLSLSGSGTDCYNEVIEEMQNGAWKEIASGQRTCVAPVGNELKSNTPGFPPMMRLVDAATISDLGVITPVSVGPVVASLFGNANDANGWTYMQQLDWQFDLVQGSGPELDDAR